MQKYYPNLKSQKGISIIQVLAVIIILGIISSIIVVNMNKNLAQSQFAMKVNQADILYEAVSKFYLENGYFPIEEPNADYLEKPVLVDLSLVAPDISEKLEGYYYLYGDENMVFYDYPEEYIQKVIGNYTEYPLLGDSIYINLEKLGNDGYLVKSPQTSYILSNDGTIKQTYDESIGEGSINIDTSIIKDKPTTPVIIPSKLAPYYVFDEITFIAKSYYSKGIKTYEWNGISSTKKYTEGTKTITAVAIGNDDVKSDIGTFTMVVNKENHPPTKPILTLNPNKPSYTSNDKVVINAHSTDPDGDRITYKWIGIEGKSDTSTANFTPNLSRGTHTISVYAIDSYGNRSEKAQTTLIVTNGKPFITNVDHVPKPAYYSNTVELKVKAVDPDGDLITFTFEGITKNKRYVRGTHKITVYAIDSFDAKSDPYVYDLVIHNRAPYPPTPDKEIPSDTGSYIWTESQKQKYLEIIMTPSDKNQKVYSYTPINFKAISYDHNGNVTKKDMDGDNLFYHWNIGTIKTVVKAPSNGDDNYTATYMPGSHTIKVRAYDDLNEYSEWVAHSFYVTNTPPTAPTITKTNSTPLYADTDITWSIGGSTDIDGHSITYHWKSTPKIRYVKGTHTVSGRALDSFGDYSTWTDFTFTVVNKPPTDPVISRTPNGTLYADTNITWTATSTDVDITDTISYEWENKASKYIKGSHVIKARAKDTDGAYSNWVSYSFTIVNSAPTTPSISMSPSTNLNSKTELTFTAYGSTDVDIADTISYEWSNKATTYQPGTHTIQARAKDSDGAYSPYGSLTFYINNTPPTVPVITMSPTTVYANTNVSFVATSTDFDTSHTVTYEWQNKATRYVKGSHTVKARAKDSFGDYSGWGSLTFNVLNTAPTTPRITSSSFPYYYEGGGTFSFTASGSTDIDVADSITYVWGSGSTGSSFSSYYSTGSYSVSVSARDSDGAYSPSTTFSFRYNPGYYYEYLIAAGYYTPELVTAGYYKTVVDVAGHYISVVDKEGHWKSVLKYDAWHEDIYETVSYTEQEAYTVYEDVPWCYGTNAKGQVIGDHPPPCQYGKNYYSTWRSVPVTKYRTVTKTKQVFKERISHPPTYENVWVATTYKQQWVAATYKDEWVPPVYKDKWIPPVYETRYSAGYWSR